MAEYSYKLRPQALNDLEAIWLYGVKRWGLAQAEKYLTALTHSFQSIAENPLLCRERDEFTPPVRIHHQGRHVVLYLIEDNHIAIIRVLHDSMVIDLHL
ncbi:MAG: plasmid stabilization protein ParE [Methylobacter sp.]|nr:MAG: plasmid stabilization protein ParE [Methylobacter sp.]PPD24159.1 MAG: plasmid stabilization protein ParE [Methylobacter sp.]PPD37527.1 MAG: plasmid stabilization protein ParE [Methylomonas sp.]